MKLKLKYFAWIGLITLVSSCATRQGLGALDMSHIYQKDGLLVRPQIRIFHPDEHRSEIYFSFSSEEVLYVRSGNSQAFTGKVDVQVFVYENFNQASIIDTAMVTIADTQSVLTPHRLNGKVEIRIDDTMPKDSYVLLIRFNDRNRKLYFDEMRLLHRTNPYGRQNYLVLDGDSNVVYSDYIQLDQPYKVVANSAARELHVRHYNRTFDPGLPPFSINGETSVFNHTADSTFSVSNGGWFTLKSKGFYHFQTDPALRDGFTLYNFESTYPLITDKTQLIGPMRFLTSNLEYEGINLKNEDSAKIAIDKFWLTHAGVEERAREQVEEYYERVEAANIFFTSYKEGWKTDRGVLYVIYGPPTKIYRTIDEETWVYGEENSSLNFTFVFDRMINPYSGNDYTLRRASQYRYGWGMAIDAWRHGKIFDSSTIKQAQNERDQQLRQSAPPYLWY